MESENWSEMSVIVSMSQQILPYLDLGEKWRHPREFLICCRRQI